MTTAVVCAGRPTPFRLAFAAGPDGVCAVLGRVWLFALVTAETSRKAQPIRCRQRHERP